MRKDAIDALLLKRSEIKKLDEATRQKGYTLVPLELYFNDENRVKVELAVAKGKAGHDKRESQKEIRRKKRNEQGRPALINMRLINESKATLAADAAARQVFAPAQSANEPLGFCHHPESSPSVICASFNSHFWLSESSKD